MTNHNLHKKYTDSEGYVHAKESVIIGNTYAGVIILSPSEVLLHCGRASSETLESIEKSIGQGERNGNADGHNWTIVL